MNSPQPLKLIVFRSFFLCCSHVLVVVVFMSDLMIARLPRNFSSHAFHGTLLVHASAANGPSHSSLVGPKEYQRDSDAGGRLFGCSIERPDD